MVQTCTRFSPVDFLPYLPCQLLYVKHVIKLCLVDLRINSWKIQALDKWKQSLQWETEAHIWFQTCIFSKKMTLQWTLNPLVLVPLKVVLNKVDTSCHEYFQLIPVDHKEDLDEICSLPWVSMAQTLVLKHNRDL